MAVDSGVGGLALAATGDFVDPATGSGVLSPPGPVFRFFDAANGTHFLTASVAERDSVLASSPNLVEETNNFGSVIAAGTQTEPIYRFFDTIDGTHFFTASQAERDVVIAGRPDLVYEPAATFLEDRSAQSRDVAVYRLFSADNGTHFYTSSQTEVGALTRPGGGYVSEGVAFYAPQGNFR